MATTKMTFDIVFRSKNVFIVLIWITQLLRLIEVSLLVLLAV